MGILSGKVAVITGSTRGLGLAIARAYAVEGAAVVIASRSEEAVKTTVAALLASGYQAAGMAVDVANLANVQSLADFCLKTFRYMDICVNNDDTTGPYGPTISFDPQVFSCVVKTNIMGTYYGSVTALHYFKKQGSGKLINMLGKGYNKPSPWQNAYGSSKVWSRHFTKALAVENNDNPAIGIYTLNPGMVLTDLLIHNDVISGSEDRLKSFPTIVRMWAKPAEIPAQKAVWLASTETDGKSGLEANVFSTWLMLGGALKEAWRKTTGNTPEKDDIQMKVVAPWQPDSK
jgi:NAD(P)-dependent dehydrogenase (short-subunit alcohol dehydrogenase family)